MAKYLWSVCAALAILGSGWGGFQGLAKPPDLPVDLGIDLDNEGPKDDSPKSGFTLGLNLVSGKLSVSFKLPWKNMTPRQQEARTLFNIAEGCRKKGDLDMARTCYEETHLLAPETDFGRLAIQRLSEIDNRGQGD